MATSTGGGTPMLAFVLTLVMPGGCPLSPCRRRSRRGVRVRVRPSLAAVSRLTRHPVPIVVERVLIDRRGRKGGLENVRAVEVIRSVCQVVAAVEVVGHAAEARGWLIRGTRQSARRLASSSLLGPGAPVRTSGASGATRPPVACRTQGRPVRPWGSRRARPGCRRARRPWHADPGCCAEYNRAEARPRASWPGLRAASRSSRFTPQMKSALIQRNPAL